MAATFSIGRASSNGSNDSNSNDSKRSRAVTSEPQDDDNNYDGDGNSHSSGVYRVPASHTHSIGEPSDADNNNTEDENNNNNCNTSHSSERATHRVRGVGWNNCANEVLLAPSVQRSAKSNVLVFPGDVMDFHAAMTTGAFREFSAFAYERVAQTLGDKFGDDCNVWIIRPARLHQGAFSCFDHFVTSNEFGAATTYDSTGSAIKHLLALLENVRDTLLAQGAATDLPVHLVGFSKGAVVLNQLITELAICKRDGFKSNNRREPQLTDISQYHKFFATVCSIHWVDSGNGSSRGVVPSDERALAAIYDCSNAQLYVHVTPYQFASNERPWIKQEIHAFVQHMRRVHVDVQLKMYYDGEEGSIHKHFQLLQDFEVPRVCCASKMRVFSSPAHSLPRVPIQSV